MLSSVPRSLLIVAALIASVGFRGVASQGFLAASPDYVSQDRVVEQLRLLLGHAGNVERLGRIEGTLRPTFMAMPKNRQSGLEHRVARYALYRYFLVEHAWHIKGLAIEADEKNSSSPTLMLKSKMPSFIIDLLERQLGSQHIGLTELAVLAATIEDLVHSDSLDLLQLAYKTYGFSKDSSLHASDADLVIRTFALFFILPSARSLTAEADRLKDLASSGATEYYPGWDDAMLWLEDLRQSLDYQDQSVSKPFAFAGRGSDFSSIAHVATAFSTGFGRFADMECKEMKNKLMDLEDEDREDGRVRLAKFYGPYLEGTSFHFSESPDYLRHLGALDEHNPLQPSVIVPNVMYARSNCLATSGFHSVCCIDDCEVLLGELEQKVPEPFAAPGLIAEVVAGISSETVAAPRNLSAPLRQRLGEIAARHGGSVPLHGRLFAQWMHYAFPNECPYPRSLLTGEAQLTPQEWEQQQKRVFASKEEMQKVLQLSNSSAEIAGASSDGPVMLWSEDEELLSEIGTASGSARSVLWSVMRFAAGLAVLVGSAVAIADMASKGGLPKSEKKASSGPLAWFHSTDALVAGDSKSHFV